MQMRIFLIAFGLAWPIQAQASCECRCVGGSMQALCSSSLDIPPICPATICEIPPASIAPIQTPRIPPIGTSECSQRQVLNPATHRYEWRSLCR